MAQYAMLEGLVSLCIRRDHPEYCETIGKCLAEQDREFMAMLEGPPRPVPGVGGGSRAETSS